MTIDEKIKTAKQKLGEKIPCSIEVLTPVHIGSGVKLAEGIDFVKDNNSVHIVPQSELMKYLEDNPDERDRFISGNYKLNSLQRIPEGRRYNISLGRTSEINEFERNGYGKPYIPGSSIKGAIRTILLKKRFDELSNDEKNNLLNKVNNPKKEWAAEPIVKKLLGDDSNKNLMRVLEIFDAEFDTVDLEKVLILSLTNDLGTSYGWKQLWNRQNTTDHKRASQISCEILPVGLKSYFSISLHNFLMNDPTANSTLVFNEDSLSDIKKLVKTINFYSNQKLNKEKEFFEKLTTPKNLTTVIKEIDNLINRLNNLSQDEFIIRISWGSGWKGMTGDFLDDNWLQIFRNKYRLGKSGFDIFPKTRRIVFEEDEPKYLTGWVKVKLNDNKPVTLKKEKIEKDEKIDSNNWAAVLSQKYNVKETKKKK
ncbi:Putative RAMP superfamily DNA repair protein [Ignavibacterium album JCM 16511]|uniref:CRISPR system Cms protein Csm5 n=1 Tax=Ignavibacterium album (strain DSM 19864 / JCM 16511 / NBRC 101810 / Mat9-16) TaxID=945713 RepID=I0AIV1_IGNAJ|nr:type III-A CRISPR-associated RAMP protein Csm5 [Ignavibacterium album]AFH48908.1 Putative RAMP superfamily DNA repair protein [Ignavibacterium album JCM 16511]